MTSLFLLLVIVCSDQPPLTDSVGNVVSSCHPCYRFEFGSCLSNYGPEPVPDPNNTNCPPAECELVGSCHLASDYSTASYPFWDQPLETMKSAPANTVGYFARKTSTIYCRKVYGCDDCWRNPDTLLQSCRVVIYEHDPIFQGAICYWNHDGDVNTAPVPATCSASDFQPAQ